MSHSLNSYNLGCTDSDCKSYWIVTVIEWSYHQKLCQIPKSSACYLLKQGPLCRCNQDKLCSPPGGCSQVRLIPLLEENQRIKRRRRLSNDAGHGGQDAVQASSTKNCQSPYVSARKRQGRPLLGMALLTHQTWTSIFQNWRIMDICWFKLLSLWHLVMAAKQKKSTALA